MRKQNYNIIQIQQKQRKKRHKNFLFELFKFLDRANNNVSKTMNWLEGKLL